jgi:hypothetical protein
VPVPPDHAAARWAVVPGEPRRSSSGWRVRS